MAHQRVPASLAFLAFALLSFIHSSASYALDPTKLYCVRQERQGAQIYLSEIRFFNAEMGIWNLTDRGFSGELVSYLVRGSKKIFVSGYSFYSVSFEDQVISGLTGDPNTHADGSFTLSMTSAKTNDEWNFVYSDTKGHQIDAVFRCLYQNKMNTR